MQAEIPTPSRRRHLSGPKGRALIEAWRSSGLTMRAFALQHGTTVNVLSYWRLRAPRAGKAAEVPPSFVELRAAPVAAPTVEIALPGGAVVRVGHGFDGDLLRSVVAALAARPC